MRFEDFERAVLLAQEDQDRAFLDEWVPREEAALSLNKKAQRFLDYSSVSYDFAQVAYFVSFGGLLVLFALRFAEVSHSAGSAIVWSVTLGGAGVALMLFAAQFFFSWFGLRWGAQALEEQNFCVAAARHHLEASGRTWKRETHE